jgi:hypothetical protein
MALYQVNAGDRILAADLNQFYAILKGVAASGEAVSLVYNAAGVIALQPSSDPAAGTEFIQVKNNAGTVQGSITSDGKFKAADGTAALPSLRMQSEASGFYLSSTGIIGFSSAGVTGNVLFKASALSIGASPATAGNLQFATAFSIQSRNNANGANINVLSTDSSDVITLAATGQSITISGAMTFSSGVSLFTAASASGITGFRVPHGAAPSSPVNGDLWTTTGGMFVRINGVTKSVNLT